MAGKQLVTKSDFARLAGVSASAIGKACKNELADAVASGKIDKSHKAAKSYLKKREAAEAPSIAEGLDDRHNEAAAWCAQEGNYSGRALAKAIGIGRDRATKIVNTLKMLGLPLADGAKIVVNAEKREARPVSGQEKARMTKKEERPPEQYDPDQQLLQIPEDIRELANWSLRDLVTKFGTDVAFLDFLKATKELENIQEKRLKNAKTSGELVSRAQIKIGVIEPINTAHIKLLTDGAKTIAVRVKAMVEAERDLTEIEEFVTKQITSFIKPMKARVARGLENV
jgi:hypothetical protein